MQSVIEQYTAFLRSKARRASPRGIDKLPPLNKSLFPYQSDCLDFALRIGSGAQFLDTGLGKSIIELDWGRVIAELNNKPVLMLAPLAVGPQHQREAAKFGIEAHYIRDPDHIKPGVNICNYERLHMFRPDMFSGIVLDESSIVKSYGGKTSLALMAFAEAVPYRLAATATPAPNDHMELGQHSQFLQVMASNEMLARWFISDQSDMGRYRLKRHGVDDFWSWVASWARMASRPSDLGYSNSGFVLPPMRVDLHYVSANIVDGAGDGELFRKVDTSATAIHKEKRITAAARADRVAEIVYADPNEPWVVWCDSDYEADELIKRIPDGVEVSGSMSSDYKELVAEWFCGIEVPCTCGSKHMQTIEERNEKKKIGGRCAICELQNKRRILITKPSIFGFGMNFQHCARTAFVGLSFSYESYYQAIRRFYRFGQKRQVQIHVALAETESIIWQTIQRKAKDHEIMKEAMTSAMQRATQQRECKTAYIPRQNATIPGWMK